ncbi:FAD-dependent oxidoreductase [Amycolatopsis orientalis]|uniref:FAD-dependent oxidoreductase n=1 Tax=Amycolatopsis orientalis TaxID=31958 RepID=UPI0009DBD900|nr:FAD-dependent oxidoreductase [Amycolatopsis orientalis]
MASRDRRSVTPTRVRHRAHARRLVVIGAGFLGLEVACAAQNLGLTVDVVEMDHRVMARAVSPDLAVRLGDAHVERGLRIRFGLAVVGFDVGHDGRVSAVQLSDGAHLAADVVVSSIGVVPNSELAAAAGLPVDNGICVDRRLATPAPDVYAIGDCAAFPVDETGRLVRLEAVSNALDQGAHVAAAILGDPRPYEGVPFEESGLQDRTVIAVDRILGHAGGPPGRRKHGAGGYRDRPAGAEFSAGRTNRMSCRRRWLRW